MSESSGHYAIHNLNAQFVKALKLLEYHTGFEGKCHVQGWGQLT